ncbi:MAG: hypothetical protein H6621_04700 [Halobacteriovoraceae bacterium]|nr:hypothetical protein [Halobacteriovoraceae bacterium]
MKLILLSGLLVFVGCSASYKGERRIASNASALLVEDGEVSKEDLEAKLRTCEESIMKDLTVDNRQTYKKTTAKLFSSTEEKRLMKKRYHAIDGAYYFSDYFDTHREIDNYVGFYQIVLKFLGYHLSINNDEYNHPSDYLGDSKNLENFKVVIDQLIKTRKNPKALDALIIQLSKKRIVQYLRNYDYWIYSESDKYFDKERYALDHAVNNPAIKEMKAYLANFDNAKATWNMYSEEVRENPEEFFLQSYLKYTETGRKIYQTVNKNITNVKSSGGDDKGDLFEFFPNYLDSNNLLHEILVEIDVLKRDKSNEANEHFFLNDGSGSQYFISLYAAVPWHYFESVELVNDGYAYSKNDVLRIGSDCKFWDKKQLERNKLANAKSAGDCSLESFNFLRKFEILKSDYYQLAKAAKIKSSRDFMSMASDYGAKIDQYYNFCKNEHNSCRWSNSAVIISAEEIDQKCDWLGQSRSRLKKAGALK